jgi:YHS domain-containing protein
MPSRSKETAVRMIVLVATAAVLAAGSVFLAGCKGEPQTAPAPAKSGSSGAAADAKVAITQKVCPVMGGEIDPTIYVDYNERRIYFCCAMCPPKFKKDPEKYLKIVDDQLKAAAAAPHSK